jgi:hypothetical protein
MSRKKGWLIAIKELGSFEYVEETGKRRRE